MEYSVMFENEVIDLPKYNFGIEETIDKIDAIKENKDKCKQIYSFLSKEIFDKESFESKFDKFNDTDPNRLLILFSEIKMAYQSPVYDAEMKKISNKIEDSNLASLVDLFKNAGEVKELMKKN